MQRVLVFFLAVLDAVIAAAIGLVVILAPLTLVWTLSIGAGGDWGVLWPATATIWQFGHAVPVEVSIPLEAVISLGIPPQGADFMVSVPPLALLLVTLLFGARSGGRAVRSGASITAVAGGVIAFAIISAGVALTGREEVFSTPLALGMVAPPLVYLAGLITGTITRGWTDGDAGVIERLRNRVESASWGYLPALIVRGSTAVVVALVGAGALGIALMLVIRGGDVLSLFESSRVDAMGATVVTLGQLAYLPTLAIWSAAWIAGPGFAVGTGTAVSPAGTQVGILPGIPILGLVPEGSSVWMLVVVLTPVGIGAFAGWMIRSRLVWMGRDPGLVERAILTAGIGLCAALLMTAAAALSSGSLGPGRMAHIGPDPWTVGVVVFGEILLGAGILLLAPRHRAELAEERTRRYEDDMSPFRRDSEATSFGEPGADGTPARD